MSGNQYQFGSGETAKIAADVAARMLDAVTFDDRWVAIQEVLGSLGATSVNSAAINTDNALPFWFRSSLPMQTLSDYVSEGMLDLDFIVKHSANSGTGFRWRTADSISHEETPEGRTFANFVREAGTQSIICLSMQPNPGREVRAITFCSEYSPKEVMNEGNLQRIEVAIRLLLPWLDWPDGFDGSDYLTTPKTLLSPRETEALRLLAGGLMNKRIADAMGISEAMVAKHLISARKKLDAKTRAEAVARAVRTAQINP